ncbi:MAG: ABC-type transport auxiliary lipoprotein family protein [bacterium]
MKKSFVIAWLLVGYLSIHCGSVPQTFYYRIDYEAKNLKDDNGTIPKTLGVTQFGVDALYEGDRIVYRQSPYEVKFYNYRRWISPPKKMVSEKILKQYQASGLFQRVVKVPYSGTIDYILGGVIQAFEEWDEGSNWYGTVAIEFRLENNANHEVVWQRVIKERVLAEKKEPLGIVKAISASLEKVVSKSISEIKTNLEVTSNNN